jgi:hypothetical protein
MGVMGGDTHFLLRHAIVGAIFLLFAWIGWWSFDADGADRFLDRQIALGASAALSAFVSSPVIGITIQGVHIFILSLFGGPFNDDARKLVASEVRKSFTECLKQAAPGLEHDQWERLKKAPDDALFVWLYHRSAPVDLIEWARRRRSYYYLGMNLVIAAAVGFGLGRLAPGIVGLGHETKEFLVIGSGVLWCVGAIWAALMMRRDVESMELLWAAARVHPGLKQCLEQSLGTRVDETFSGSDPARNRAPV